MIISIYGEIKKKKYKIKRGFLEKEIYWKERRQTQFDKQD